MSKPTEAKGVAENGEPRRFHLVRAARLGRAERVVLLILVGGSALVDFLVILGNPTADPLRGILSIATTLTFSLFIWSPLAATITLGVAVALAFAIGNGVAGMLAGAVAAAPILRLAATPLIISYTAGLLVATSLIAYGLGGVESSAANVALLLLAAVFAGGIGLALRMTHARGNRLEHALQESAEREREAVLAERRWIAGELHDSIAHYLTIIALHVQLLDDETMRPDSQDAIRTSARKALSDLRFVIELAEDEPRGEGVPSGDLAEAVDEASAEFRAAGHAVHCDGDPSDESIPRGVEIILARIVRESATNILKYAGAGEVRFRLSIEAGAIGLDIRSPLPETPRRDLPSTGTGLNRMAERVLGVSGTFHAGPADDEPGTWSVIVRLPTE